MNKYLRSFIFLTLALICASPSFANHVFGADFYYEYISGSTYKVSLAIYGDCNAANDPSSPFNNLPNAQPVIQFRNGTVTIQSLTLTLESPGVDVTPVCPREKLNTKCNGGSIDGVMRFIYSTTVNVNIISANLNFRFEGELGASQAGRSNQITNLSAPGSSIMVLNAELNNTLGPNSSPRFTTIPTPFYCVNVPQQYNQGAVDANNDSLGYQLVAPLEGVGTASYVPGYDAINPLAAVNGTFTFSQITGQLNFTPSITQKSLVVNKVNEYRNGVKVGSASRELTFVVLANCTANIPPTGKPDTTSGRGVGGIMVADNTFNVCEGTGLIKFNINPVDADLDTIEVSVAGLPTGANAIITNNNTPAPVINFSWNAATLAPGNYNFFVTYKDNGCPVSASQTQAFTISVIKPNQLTSKVIFPTECAHKAKMQYNLSYGLLPRTIVIRQGATILKTLTDNTGIVSDSLDAGTYSFTITSRNLTCPTIVNVVVRDSGTYPYPPTFPDAFYCLNDPAVALTATPALNGNIFWYDSLGTKLGNAPVPNTSAAGIFRYMASQKVKVCESKQDTALVYVTKRPIADFIIDPSPICAQDTATVSFTGAIGVGPILDYKWNWGAVRPISGDSSGPYKISWYNGGTYTIKLQVFENKCPSDSIAKQIRVKPKPTAAFTALNSICQYDSVLVTYSTPDSLAGQQYAWDFNGATLPQSNDKGPFLIHWENSGSKLITLEVSLEGCTDTVSHVTDVHDSPDARIVNVPGTVCLGDKILLEYVATGQKNTYTWLPKNKIDRELNGATSTRVYVAPTTYTLVVKNEFSCLDSASITYTTVEPCCQFSYPNAFTPNNDGKNDKYRVRLYGNQEYYDLSIFNRWGQRVFHSSEPSEGWDGTYNSKPCDMGVYYYIIRAKCLTGYEESKQGELTLMR